MQNLTNEDIFRLAMDLLHAEGEEEVVQLLEVAGLWSNPAYWRLLGDDENNFKTVGAQQARPEPALVEKLVNAVDARLTAACIHRGIDPAGNDAPQTILDARNIFFHGADRTDLAKCITLAITGARPQQPTMPCLTICDIGEGQTPRQVPETFMSIDRKNKLRIPFVQGKFNMGGTGALMFCGRRKIQLLLTRRDPKVLEMEGTVDPADSDWSVTIVRRESPPEGPGHVRNPYFKYLAPIGSENLPEDKRSVLTFSAESINSMPEANKPYERAMSWGTCIKLYNYDMRGFKGHILRTGGLLSRVEVLLPEMALPIRAHECRAGLKGHSGSFDTNLIGLRERLECSRGDGPLEPGYPASLPLNVQGQLMTARIYAFKGDNADRYRADQGVVFAINGQTHGWFPKSFFERKNVKMARLAKSLLIVVDCTDISVESRADLFKNSRDRLSGGDLRRDIEADLEKQIADHPGLRELRERRRHEEVAEKLGEAKPLEDVLRAIMKSSPSLSKLFLLRQRLSSPFRAELDGGAGDGVGNAVTKREFTGKRHPTFFRFEKLKDGESLLRTSEQGRRCRLKFTTDVENEYFIRDADRGKFHVEVVDGPLQGRELTNSISLYNGLAHWNVSIPEEDVAPSDLVTIELTVFDDVIAEPIVNIARITITPRVERQSGKEGTQQSSEEDAVHAPSNSENGGKRREGKDGPPAGIQLPSIKKIRRDGWEPLGFDDRSACTVIDEGGGDDDDENDTSVYQFYVNVDNVFLLTDLKNGNIDPALSEAKFVYGNVLVGLALIHDQKNTKKNGSEDSDTFEEGEEPTIARRIEQVTRALAPFLVPMVDYLGGLDSQDASQLVQAGDEE